MQLASEIQKKSSYIWIHPLHNCSCCNCWVSAPVKRIFKSFHCAWLWNAWFQMFWVGPGCPRRQHCLPSPGLHLHQQTIISRAVTPSPARKERAYSKYFRPCPCLLFLESPLFSSFGLGVFCWFCFFGCLDFFVQPTSWCSFVLGTIKAWACQFISHEGRSSWWCLKYFRL